MIMMESIDIPVGGNKIGRLSVILLVI